MITMYIVEEEPLPLLDGITVVPPLPLGIGITVDAGDTPALLIPLLPLEENMLAIPANEFISVGVIPVDISMFPLPVFKAFSPPLAATGS